MGQLLFIVFRLSNTVMKKANSDKNRLENVSDSFP